MTAIQMSPKVFDEEELSILFARLTDAAKEDWKWQRGQMKDGEPIREVGYSIEKLRNAINRHHPGAFVDQWRFSHFRNAGLELMRDGETGKPKISQLEVQALLDFFFAGPLDRKHWPKVIALMEEGEGAKYLGLAAGADMPEHERHLMRAFQALNNEHFAEKEKVNTLERKYRQASAISTAQEVKIQQLKADLDKRAKEYQERAQKLRDDLAQLESTTKGETKEAVVAILDELNRIL